MGFIKIQKKSGVDCYWITIKNDDLILKKGELLNRVIKINPKIIHIHGIWNLSTRIIPQLKNITKNIIVSPHGMLNKESFRKSYLARKGLLKYFKKMIYFYFFEKKNLNQIKSFHALTEVEYKEIKLIFPNKPIKIISTGSQLNDSEINSKMNNNLIKSFHYPSLLSSREVKYFNLLSG